jgi:adenine deaminase
MNQHLLEVAAGRQAADLVVVNGQIVNVYSGEIYAGGVAVSEDTIVAVGKVNDFIGENTRVVDAKGNYITPGFIDAHIHPESSNMSIRNFAKTVQAHGTSVIMTDLHEIGVVSDLKGIECVLEEAKETTLKIYFVVPSHVPLAPELETSAGHFTPEKIGQALHREDAVGISEVIGTSVAAGKAELLETMDIAKAQGKSLQGHLAGVSGKSMNVCLTAGITTDHESVSSEDALERLRNGCFLMMREGAVGRNLKACLKPILENHLDTANTCIVTDDLHTLDAIEKGHLDESVRTALAEGVDFVTAIQMVSFNAAKSFRLEHEVGGLAPGRRADINITTGPEDFKVLTSIAGGQVFMEEEKVLVDYSEAKHDDCLMNTMHLDHEITPEELMLRVDDGRQQVKVCAMQTEDCFLVTSGIEANLPVQNGVVQCDVAQDVLYIAQVERHGVNGNIGKAFMSGFNLKSGAIASSIGHDNHNIIVLGTNHEDMALAVNEVAKMQGGQIVVDKGEVVAQLALPICGLLSDLPPEELAQKKRELNEAIRERGGTISIPFMVLSFICLAAIPEYAVTDCGFIDVFKGQVISPIIE